MQYLQCTDTRQTSLKEGGFKAGGCSRTQGAPVRQAHGAPGPSDQAQGQHYGDVGLAEGRNNGRSVPEPREHPNSWEIAGPSVASLNGTQRGIAHTHTHTCIFSASFPESPADFLPTSYQAATPRFTLISSHSLSLSLSSVMPRLGLCVLPKDKK